MKKKKDGTPDLRQLKKPLRKAADRAEKGKKQDLEISKLIKS